jgi:hypothetical protein
LKISGVWENAEEIGITYKFIEICENTRENRSSEVLQRKI